MADAILIKATQTKRDGTKLEMLVNTADVSTITEAPKGYGEARSVISMINDPYQKWVVETVAELHEREREARGVQSYRGKRDY